jgi:hypothetical protein
MKTMDQWQGGTATVAAAACNYRVEGRAGIDRSSRAVPEGSTSPGVTPLDDPDSSPVVLVWLPMALQFSL